MQATARRLSVVSATSTPRRRLIRDVRPTRASLAMPPPIQVELVPYSTAWPESASLYRHSLSLVLGTRLLAVHHVGSTAVPGLSAKPIIDLMPVLDSISSLDDSLPELERIGFRSWGELGIPGRHYFTKDSETGVRLIQLHCFQLGSPHIERHLAFRDYLISHPVVASRYLAEKQRCASLHPADSHAYSGCKADWIIRVESEAITWYRHTTAKPRANKAVQPTASPLSVFHDSP